MKAEYIEFNGDWHKTCFKCRGNFGAHSCAGLSEFFYKDKSQPDGFKSRCKKCDNIRRNKKTSKWAKEHYPEKYAARSKLNNAAGTGRIKKPKQCEHCNLESRLHGHHTDYSKPLDVIWLCNRCHRKEHANVSV